MYTININPILIIAGLLIIMLVSKNYYNAIILTILISIIYILNVFNIVTFAQLQDIFLKFIDIIYDYHPVSKFNTNRNIENFKNKISDKDDYNSVQLKELFNLIPPLSKYEALSDDIENFIKSLDRDNLDTNQQIRAKNIESIKNSHYIKELKKHIAYIYHYSYYTVKDKYYPQHNYMESIKSQKETA